MQYYTYILLSEKTNKYYIGSCRNIEEGLKRHNAGATPSIKPGRLWKVIFSEVFNSKPEALIRENYLKRMKAGFLKKIISEC